MPPQPYIYTDGSKVLDRVAAAAISDHHQSKIRLQGDASIYTAELQALKIAFNLIKDDRSKEFIIFSDSLSCLIALQGSKYDHPLYCGIIT